MLARPPFYKRRFLKRFASAACAVSITILLDFVVDELRLLASIWRVQVALPASTGKSVAGLSSPFPKNISVFS